MKYLLLLLLFQLAAAQYRNQYPYNQNGYQQQQQQQQPQQYQNQNGYQNRQMPQQQQQQMRQQQIPGQQQQFNSQQNLLNQQQQPIQQYGVQQNGQISRTGASRAAVSTNPIRMTNSTDMGAHMTLSLRSYSNPTNSLDSDTTCACPTVHCEFLRPTEQNNCQFSFMVVISSADQTVKMHQSDFMPFSQSINTGNWTQPIDLYLPSKPSAIDVFVQHLGAVIRRSSAQLLNYDNRLVLVDSFAIPLLQVDPTTGNGRLTTTIHSSLLQQSSLSFDLVIQCTSGFLGKNCDLKCGGIGTNSNTDYVLCRSTITSEVQSCRYNSGKTQVQECMTCLTYNSTSNTCVGTNLHAEDIGVSRAYRTWTIVLAVLLLLAVIVIVCLIVSWLICRNREREEYEQAPAVYKNPTVYPAPTSRDQNGTAAGSDEWPTSPARRPLIDHDAPHDDIYRRTTVTTTQRQEHAV